MQTRADILSLKVGQVVAVRIHFRTGSDSSMGWTVTKITPSFMVTVARKVKTSTGEENRTKVFNPNGYERGHTDKWRRADELVTDLGAIEASVANRAARVAVCNEFDWLRKVLAEEPRLGWSKASYVNRLEEIERHVATLRGLIENVPENGYTGS